MKVLGQWAKRDPEDFFAVDAREWASLPKRPVPRSGELGARDNTPGWLVGLNVQGILFDAFDHVAIEPITVGRDEGVRVVVWTDDPEDVAVGGQHARVWTILPPAPDPALGFAINTRQSQIIYADGERYQRLLSARPQNTTVRPWAEFVPPPEEITRHTVWVSDVKWAEHRTVRSRWGWRQWCDEFPDEEVVNDALQRRTLRVQRDLGRYRRANHTITYFQRSINRPASAWASFPLQRALELTAGSGGNFFSIQPGINDPSAVVAFTSPTGSPGSTSWNGVYHVQVDCAEASGGVSYGVRPSVASPGMGVTRLSSDLIFRLQTVFESQPEFTGTGLRLFTSGFEVWTSPSASDCFGFGITARGDSPGDLITIEVDHADAYADGPWPAGTVFAIDPSGFHEAVGVVTSEIEGQHEAAGIAATEYSGVHEVLTTATIEQSGTFEALQGARLAALGAHEAMGIVPIPPFAEGAATARVASPVSPGRAKSRILRGSAHARRA